MRLISPRCRPLRLLHGGHCNLQRLWSSAFGARGGPPALPGPKAVGGGLDPNVCACPPWGARGTLSAGPPSRPWGHLVQWKPSRPKWGGGGGGARGAPWAVAFSILRWSCLASSG